MTLVLLELNEVDFSTVEKYIAAGQALPSFQKIIKKGMRHTSAENSYELLEPWIQWPSVHTGKVFEEHGVFRLGDGIKYSGEQIFELVESMGFKVGAVSPMNADNRLISPAYFIPDPWTDTKSDGSILSSFLHQALAQAVNDNSKSQISLPTVFKILLVFLLRVSPGSWLKLIWVALRSFRFPWRRALFLDMFLFEVHQSMLRRECPDLSVLFLNAGAHIQHHYYLNARHLDAPKIKNPNWYVSDDEDPFLDMLEAYDEIIGEVLASGDDVIIATGLSQQPFSEAVFYYRLHDHAEFLTAEEIAFDKVEPRMTRDFLITCKDEATAVTTRKSLEGFLVDGNERLFGEIDCRGNELFVTLTYPNEITLETTFNSRTGSKRLSDYVVFVAIKNGEHNGTGYCYMSPSVPSDSLMAGGHVSQLFFVVKEYFNRKLSSPRSGMPLGN